MALPLEFLDPQHRSTAVRLEEALSMGVGYLALSGFAASLFFMLMHF